MCQPSLPPVDCHTGFHFNKVRPIIISGAWWRFSPNQIFSRRASGFNFFSARLGLPRNYYFSLNFFFGIPPNVFFWGGGTLCLNLFFVVPPNFFFWFAPRPHKMINGRPLSQRFDNIWMLFMRLLVFWWLFTNALLHSGGHSISQMWIGSHFIDLNQTTKSLFQEN